MTRRHDSNQDDTALGTDEQDAAIDRRRALGLGALAAGAVWAAPAVLSIDAAAAQTPAACNPCATVEVTLNGCLVTGGTGFVRITDSGGNVQTDTIFPPINPPYVVTFQGVCPGPYTIDVDFNGFVSCGTPLGGNAICRGLNQITATCLC